MNRYLLGGLVARFRAGHAVFLLGVFGVALGVASVLSVQILGANAVGAFAGSVRAVSGDADLTVAPAGSVLPESLLVEVLATAGVRAAWPVQRTQVAVEGGPALYLEVLGLDLLAPRELPWRERPADFTAALAEPGWAALSPELAAERGWRAGDTLWVSLGSRRVPLVVGTLVDFRKLSPLASTRLCVLDLAQAQHLFGRPGEVDQIDLRVEEGSNVAGVQSALSARLGEVARVLPPEARRAEAERLLEAFRLNLFAFSLVSLFVGAFLVFTSTRALLLRRRREFGVLRALGATRSQVLMAALAEAGLVGLLGTALGLPLGYWIAQANVDSVSATIANLYLLEEIEQLALPARLWLAAVAVGAAAALAGAAGPSLEVSRRDPRSLLAAYPVHETLERRSGPLAAAGLVIVGAALVVQALAGEGWRPGGFVVGFALLVALPLAAPLVVRIACGRIPAKGFGLGYGLRSLALRLPTSASAVAALAAAAAMLIAITILIGSFRRTVEVWVGDTARADVYITSDSWSRARREAVLDDPLVREMVAQAGVRAADRLRQVHLYLGERRIAFAGLDTGLPEGIRRFSLLEGDAAEADRRLRQGWALVSEPLARKERIHVGDTLRVPTPGGTARLPVAGVYYDYTSEGGGAFVSLESFERLFGPGPVNNVALYLEGGVSPEAMANHIRARFPDRALRVRSNRALREEILAIFDQTFAVTRLLEALALVIAVSGVTLSLLVLARERLAELALYRALGARRRQVLRIFLGKGAGISLLGLLLGAAGGLGLALVLVYAINRAWFGWTIAVHWPWPALAREAALVLVASLAASLYPALRASRTPATELSREDV